MTPMTPMPRREPLFEGDLTREILAVFYTVYTTLGYGFLESVYVNALVVELQLRGFKVEREVPVEVVYVGVPVGTYRMDLVVEGRVLLEVKAGKCMHEADEAQTLNYLRASEIKVALLLHFGPKPQFRRVVHTRK
jgi:GxxExxY protein